MTGLLSPGEIRDLRQEHYNATVVRLVKVHSDLALFRLQPDFPFPVHKPGQYTTLGLGNWEPRLPGCAEETLNPNDVTRLARRAYSLSHPILDAQGNLATADPNAVIEFYVVLVRRVEEAGAPALTP